MENRIEVFIIFDKEDVASLKEIKKHLKPLEMQSLIKVWDASNIVGGTDWKQAMDSHLKTASIFLLLVSANFIASPDSYALAKQAIARSAPPKVFVIPILLHEVDWESSELGTFAPLPANRKPIGSWPRRDVAYTEIAKSIRAIVAEKQNAVGETLASEHLLSLDHASQQKQPEIAPLPLSQDNIFDVFLCYNSKDRGDVREIARQLKVQGILPWLDEWELQPGLPWQRALEQQIGQIKSAAVFVGESGLGPWQNMEIEAFLREFVKRRCFVIPVLLKTSPDKPQLPLFLAGMTWVDFRTQQPDPMQQLIWGITAKKPVSNDIGLIADDSTKR